MDTRVPEGLLDEFEVQKRPVAPPKDPRGIAGSLRRWLASMADIQRGWRPTLEVWLRNTAPTTVTLAQARSYLSKHGFERSPRAIERELDRMVLSGHAVSRTVAGARTREWRWWPQYLSADALKDTERRKAVAAWRRARGGA